MWYYYGKYEKRFMEKLQLRQMLVHWLPETDVGLFAREARCKLHISFHFCWIINEKLRILL